ncbi:MAG: hypothetical protein JRD93_21350 [Deltaproteobacteria bacterium]|nr:hypothetical protein [Deltaproteobacteria bacterium]
MKRIEHVLMALVIVVISATPVLAEMPKSLQGTWIIDAEATETYIKTSPKWKAEDAKYLPTIMKRMSQVVYEFDDDSITVSMRGKKQPLQVALKQSEKKSYIFEGNVGDKVFTLTVSITDEGNLNIRSSATDDMDYYLWKRGQPDNKAEVDDKKLAIELMKKSLENSSNKSDAGDGK